MIPSNRPADLDELVDDLIADPPFVHTMPTKPQGVGVWSSDRELYSFLARHCPPDAQTLETGVGVSTVLLTILGAHHTCISPVPEEADRLREYLRSREIDATSLELVVESSEIALPNLRDRELDLVLIDGGHGFPIPMIDWFYACRWLKRDGIVVIDDVQLPAVDFLCLYLDRDPRWERLDAGAKSPAYKRLTDAPLGEDHYQQPFFFGPDRQYFSRRYLARLRTRAALLLDQGRTRFRST